MGDTLAARNATLTARVLGLNRARDARAGLYTLLVVRNGLPVLLVPILSGDSYKLSFPSLGVPSRYSLQVMRLGPGIASIEAVSSPIWIDPAGDPEG